MGMEQLGTGIIGLGKVAHTHAAALASLPRSHFVSVFTRNTARAAEFAARYGVRPYTDLEQMLADPGLQVVTVCTPHLLHAEQAIMAARAGKHVLVEKPMAITLADCDRMIEAAQAAGVKLGVISQRRFYPPVLRVKRAIEAGKIGEPVMGVLMMLGWRSREY